jgi:hypothetical protein
MIYRVSVDRFQCIFSAWSEFHPQESTGPPRKCSGLMYQTWVASTALATLWKRKLQVIWFGILRKWPDLFCSNNYCKCLYICHNNWCILSCWADTKSFWCVCVCVCVCVCLCVFKVNVDLLCVCVCVFFFLRSITTYDPLFFPRHTSCFFVNVIYRLPEFYHNCWCVCVLFYFIYFSFRGNLSESEGEMDGPLGEVVLPQEVRGRGNVKAQQSAIRWHKLVAYRWWVN